MTRIKFLVVEDEAIVALEIKQTLQNLGYYVINTAYSYDTALECVKVDMPDIIIMDINLKNSKDGIETVQAIHKIKKVPVIYLTAYSDDETIDRAVQTDPLNYMVKPFKRDTLKSTLALSLYKLEKIGISFQDNSKVDLGFGYYYDLYNENLFYKELPIKIGSNENKLLKVLVEAKGTIVPFENLEYQIWGNEPVSNSTLRTLLYRLRTKLEHKLIETIPSFGCKIIPNE